MVGEVAAPLILRSEGGTAAGPGGIEVVASPSTGGLLRIEVGASGGVAMRTADQGWRAVWGPVS